MLGFDWPTMAAVALRSALERMGCSQDAANIFATEVNTLSAWMLLTDEQVTNMVKTARRPGGTVAATTGDGTVPDPGVKVTGQTEENLKRMVYFLKWRFRTSQSVIASAVTLAAVSDMNLIQRKIDEAAHEHPAAPSLDPNNWQRNKERIDLHLRNCLGRDGDPLLYVVRPSRLPADVPDGATMDEVLIGRRPHFSDQDGNVLSYTYQQDNKTVFNIIHMMCQADAQWLAQIRPATSTQDGRAAYEALMAFYLGENNAATQYSNAKNTIATTFWNGQNRNFTFDKYVTRLQEQFTILNELRDQYGPDEFEGIGQRGQVIHLVSGIKTSALDAVKTRIQSSGPEIQKDFTRAVGLFKDFILAGKAGKTGSLGISVVDIQQGAKPEDIDDRYYSAQEYAALSDEQKHALKVKRSGKDGKRGGGPRKNGQRGRGGNGKGGGNQGGGGGGDSSGLSEAARQQITRSISSMFTSPTKKFRKSFRKMLVDKADDEDEGSEDSEVEAPRRKKKKKTRNRENPALER